MTRMFPTSYRHPREAGVEGNRISPWVPGFPLVAGMTHIKRNKNQARRSLRPHPLSWREWAEVERGVLFDAVAVRELRDVPTAAQCLDQRSAGDEPALP